MALFRRRKSAGGTKGNKFNKPSSNSPREQELQGQVVDLQEEMKRISKRLVAMQANVQNTDSTLSPTTTVNVPTPVLSLRPEMRPEASFNRPSLPCDKMLQGNRSFRKKKGMDEVFVPHEIDFVSNEMVYNRKSTDRREICVSNIFRDEPPPPVREIDIRNDNDTKDFDLISMQLKDIGDGSYSTNKVMTLQHCKNVRQSSSKAFGDAESTTSTQRSTFTTKNGRKVRRIVRKVRPAGPPPETTTTNTTSVLRATVPRERGETRSSLLPTMRSRQPGLSTKRPESLDERSRMKFCDVFVDGSNELSFSTKASTYSNHVKNEHDNQASSQQTRTSSFVRHRKTEHPANSILLEKSQESQVSVSRKETKEKPQSLDKRTAARLDMEIVLHRPHLDEIDEFKPNRVLSSKEYGPIGCTQAKTTLEGPGKSRTTALVHSKPNDSLLAHVQMDAKSKHFQKSVPKYLHSMPGLQADLRAGAESNQIEKSVEKAPNPKSGCLFADIRSGFKLNKVTKSTEQNLGPTLDFRGDLQQGVKRNQVERSTEASPHSLAKLLKPKNNEISPVASQNPKNVLLAGIKTGANLKQIDRSSLQGQKKRETPVSPKNILLEGIKTGANLKQVDRSSLQGQKKRETPMSPKNILLEGIKTGANLKQVDRSSLQGQKKRETPVSPKNILLEGIKAGVELKQVDRSSLQGQKKRETPMSALLAKIQERKQEFLRQEHSFVGNPEQSSEIDW